MLVRITASGGQDVWVNPDTVRTVTRQSDMTLIDHGNQFGPLCTDEPLDSVVARLNYINTETREHADPTPPPPRPFDN